MSKPKKPPPNQAPKVARVPAALPEITAAVQTVANLFRSSKVGEVIEYGLASAAAGFDIVHRRNVANSARKMVLKEDGIHIGCVRGLGFKRLSHEEASDDVGSHLRRARQQARRGRQKAEHIDIVEIHPDKRATFIMRASLCAMVDEGTNSKSQTKVLGAASNSEDNAVLAMRQTLEALKVGG